MSPAAAKQRFSAKSPCPVCHGHPELPQGQGVRCVGYLDSSGEYARCTREEYAGSIPPNNRDTPPTYSHILHGPCDCGTEHGPEIPEKAEKKARAKAKADPDKKLVHKIEWPIRAFDGQLQAIHVREDWETPTGLHFKEYPWKQPNGKAGLNGASPTDMLYNCELLSQHPGRAVAICEGEKAAAALQEAAGENLVVVGTVCGAPTVPSEEVLSHLSGRQVFIWPDNDDQGRKQMDGVAARLKNVRSIREVKWTDAPEKGDAADFLAHHSAEEALELLRNAQKLGSLAPMVEKRGLSYYGYFPVKGAELWFRSVHEARGGTLQGELSVTIPSEHRHLIQAQFNMGALATRESWAKSLDRLYEGPFEVWRQDVLEQFCLRVMSMHRTGSPAMVLKAPDPTREKKSTMALQPVLWKEGVTIFFGPSGGGKSVTGGACMLSMATGLEIIPGFKPQVVGPVAIGDWEDGYDDWVFQIQALCNGMGIPFPDNIHYRRMRGSLPDQIEDIAEWIKSKGIVGFTIDAIEAASGGYDDQGPNQRAERFFDATREIENCAILAIDHVSAEVMSKVREGNVEDILKSIGGVRKRDRSRAMYLLGGDMEHPRHEMEVLLRDVKRNRRAIQPDRYLVVNFSDFDEDERGQNIRVTTRYEASAPVLVSAQSLTTRINRYLLENGARQEAEIVKALNEKQNKINVYLGRMLKSGKVVKLKDGRYAAQSSFDYGAIADEGVVPVVGDVVPPVVPGGVVEGTTTGSPYGGGEPLLSLPSQTPSAPNVVSEEDEEKIRQLFPFSQPYRPEDHQEAHADPEDEI